jgi:predicted Zn-ribbon and HTH transcriptional regulator
MSKKVAPIGMVQLTGCRCRCGHEWLPRDPTDKPRVCPKCKSPNWDRPKRRPGRPKVGEAEASAVRGT